MSAKTEKIRELIYTAFAGRRPETLSSEEATELMPMLCTLFPEDFQYWLPAILDHLLDHHGDTTVLDNIQWVFGALDVAPADDYEWTQHTFGRCSAEYARRVNNGVSCSREKAVNGLSTIASHAIYQWLCLALEWPEVQVWRSEIESGIRYWRNRGNLSES